MHPTSFIGKNGVLIPWEQATTHLLTHTLHYGGGAFEGIRCYKTEKGPAIFRLKEHIARLFYSASVLKMNLPFSEEEIVQAVTETVRKNKLECGYIRPLVYFGYGSMGIKIQPETPVDVAIACWPWGKYLPEDAVKVKISSVMRIHPKSTVADAKLCGNYVNSILAEVEIRGTAFHEALFLDHEGNIAEGPGENIFIIKGEKLITPKPGSILPGITRDTIFTLAKDIGYEFEEATITTKQLFEADEAFFTGTAAEVTPIASIDDHIFSDGNPVPSQQCSKKSITKPFTAN
jgi:branched-chain amino acid aminotransferase